MRIKGAGNLNRQALAILRELASWREQEARERNRPRGHIVTDQALLYLSARQIQNLDAMRQCEALTTNIISQYGQQILALINKGLLCPAEECPSSLSHANRARPNRTSCESSRSTSP